MLHLIISWHRCIILVVIIWIDGLHFKLHTEVVTIWLGAWDRNLWLCGLKQMVRVRQVLKCEKVPCNELGFSPWFKLFQFLAGFWFSCLWFYSQAKSWAFAACVSVRSSPCCACLMIGCSVNPALSPVHQSHTRTGFHQRSRSSCLTSSSSFDRPPPLHPLFLLHFPPPGHCGRGLNYKGGGVSITT